MSDIGLEPMTSSLSSWRSNQTELIAQYETNKNFKTIMSQLSKRSSSNLSKGSFSEKRLFAHIVNCVASLKGTKISNGDCQILLFSLK